MTGVFSLSVHRYSWDEGETWTPYKFSEEEYRIYGILTEPGEKTTIFSVFGSRSAKHSWIIIKVDLKSIFSKYGHVYTPFE